MVPCCEKSLHLEGTAHVTMGPAMRARRACPALTAREMDVLRGVPEDETDLESLGEWAQADGRRDLSETLQLPTSVQREFVSQLNVGETLHATPHDGVAGRCIAGSGKVATKSCDLD